MITMYSTGCPRCKILEEKLQNKNIDFSIVTDEEIMEKKGIDMVPVLELENGQMLSFGQAVKWINIYTGED